MRIKHWEKVRFFFVTVSSTVLALSICIASPPGQPLERYGEVPDFQGTAVTSISQRTIQKADLLGRPWVANFIFTSCQGTCPKQTRQMIKLQRDLPRDFRLVSFSVDPQIDQPEILRKFARENAADPKRWSFIRMDQESLSQLLAGLKLGIENNSPLLPASEPVRSSKCILFDRKGQIRGYYECVEDEFLLDLKRDVDKLLSEQNQYISLALRRSSF